MTKRLSRNYNGVGELLPRHQNEYSARQINSHLRNGVDKNDKKEIVVINKQLFEDVPRIEAYTYSEPCVSERLKF